MASVRGSSMRVYQKSDTSTPALDAGDELGDATSRRPAPRPRRRRHRRRPTAGAPRWRAIGPHRERHVDGVAGRSSRAGLGRDAAVVGERHGRAAVDERPGAGAGVPSSSYAEPDRERVVDERDRGIELVLADPYERAPLVDRLAVEPGDGEASRGCRRPRSARAPPRSGRAAARPGRPHARALAAARAPSAAPSSSAERERGVAGHAVGAVVAGDAGQATLGRPRRSRRDRPSWRSAPVQWLVRQ